MESINIDNASSFADTIGGAGGYDAILIVGFGGPERREDVLPFLENVTRGRNVPRERLLEVAEHYYHFGGVSPINAQVRELIAALKPELMREGISLPIYWGNRNWHPLLADTLAEMTARGVKRALAIVLAAYSSYSSCRQYREDIARPRPARAKLLRKSIRCGSSTTTPSSSPPMPSAFAKRSRDVPGTARTRSTSRSPRTASRLRWRKLRVRAAASRNLPSGRRRSGNRAERWASVYQSRSGRPEDPWLEPDILDHLKDLKQRGAARVLIHPIGFLSDHMEVLYDLDEEARLLCDELGLEMVRGRTVGTHPRFVRMLRS